MVDDEVIGEKFFRRGKAFVEQAPQTTTADFAARAGEAVDGALGVFAGGFADVGVDAEPITRGGDFAEGYAGLGHAEGTGVHAKKDNFLFVGGGEAKVLLVRGPGVVERIVNVGHGVGEGESIAAGAQVAGGLDYFFGGHLGGSDTDSQARPSIVAPVKERRYRI